MRKKKAAARRMVGTRRAPNRTAVKKRAKRTAARKGAAKAGKKRTWIITTSSDRPITAIGRDVANAGFKGRRLLKETGSIIVSAEDKSIPKLRAIRGVVDVSPDMDIDVGPPDSSMTW